MRRSGLLLVLLLALLVTASHAGAQAGVDVRTSNARNEFPNGIVFTLDAAADAGFDEVRLVYEVAPDGVRTTAAPSCTGTTVVSCTHRLGASQRDLLIPGAQVSYYWTLSSSGATQETDPQQIDYEDTRFDWQTLTQGNVAVWYYDASEEDARAVAGAAQESLDSIGALLQTTVPFTVNIRYYATAEEMQQAIIADNDEGVITLGEVVYSNTAMVSGDASPLEITRHEVAHIVVRQAIGDAFSVPDWLNEGTAVYAQGQPLNGQRRAVEDAIERGDVLSVRSLSSASSGASSDKVLLFYGQSWSLVNFLIETYGNEKFAELFRVFSQGASDDDALLQAYGFDQDGLENVWRASVGLPPRTPVQAQAATPSPVPTDNDTPSPDDDGGSSNIVLIVVIAALTVVLAGSLVAAGVAVARRYR